MSGRAWPAEPRRTVRPLLLILALARELAAIRALVAVAELAGLAALAGLPPRSVKVALSVLARSRVLDFRPGGPRLTGEALAACPSTARGPVSLFSFASPLAHLAGSTPIPHPRRRRIGPPVKVRRGRWERFDASIRRIEREQAARRAAPRPL